MLSPKAAWLWVRIQSYYRGQALASASFIGQAIFKLLCLWIILGTGGFKTDLRKTWKFTGFESVIHLQEMVIGGICLGAGYCPVTFISNSVYHLSFMTQVASLLPAEVTTQYKSKESSKNAGQQVPHGRGPVKHDFSSEKCCLMNTFSLLHKLEHTKGKIGVGDKEKEES